MKYDCLIVDDEIELANNTCEYLNLFGVKSYACYNKSQCEEFLKENDTSLILLDINLSDGTGFELCKKIRQDKDVPILFISARNTDDDKIIALNIGGDDYIEKPYSLGVLLAKVKAVLKRYGKNDIKKYDDGNLKVDYIDKKVYIKNKEIKLTSLEFKLLTYLIDRQGKLVTKNELFEKVWNDKFTQDRDIKCSYKKNKRTNRRKSQRAQIYYYRMEGGIPI